WLPLVLLGLSVSLQDKRIAPLIFGGCAFGVALLAGHPQSALYVFIVSAAYAVVVGLIRGYTWRSIGIRIAALFGIGLGISAIQWLPSLELMQLSSRSTLTYSDYAKGFELQDPLQMLLPGSVSYYSPLYIGVVPLALALLAPWLPRRPPRIVLFWL